MPPALDGGLQFWDLASSGGSQHASKVEHDITEYYRTAGADVLREQAILEARSNMLGGAGKDVQQQ